MQAHLRALQESNADGLIPLEKNSTIVRTRCFAQRIRAHFDSTNEHYQNIVAHPFDYLSVLFDENFDPEWTDQNESMEWMSTFQLKYLNHVALVVIGIRYGALAGEIRKNFVYSLSALRRFVNEVVQKTHPEMAALILERLEKSSGNPK